MRRGGRIPPRRIKNKKNVKRGGITPPRLAEMRGGGEILPRRVLYLRFVKRRLNMTREHLVTSK
jgi:hypothetical protein